MNQDDTSEPADEYRSRLAAREQTFKLLDRRHRTLGNANVALLLLTAVVSWLALGNGLLSPLWIAAPALCLVALAVIHERMIVRRKSALRAVSLYRDALDRLVGRWVGRGSSGSRFRSSEHPYAEDLDLYGPGSLFELVCAARTRAGEDRLARWLGRPSDITKVRARQRAVIELTHRLDLREDIALLGEETAESVNLGRLSRWACQQLPVTANVVRLAALAITIVSIVAATYAAAGFSRLPLELFIVIGQLLAFSRRKSDALAALGIEKSARDLNILSTLLARLERETFQAPTLAKLAEQVSGRGEPPSKRIARLMGIVTWRDAMRSNLFSIIGIALLWNTHSAIALEHWRRESGRLVPAWIDALSTFEAISSLSRFAYEQPEVTLPDLVESETVFEAVGLKHPLLSRADAIPNTLSISTSASLYIVSGSNMSGKSTLLRTVGINTVLALAGAPVCANKMRIGPMHIGASLRAGDSLQAGVSRFYAEIKRLRQIVDIARETPPALFLLDEILHGTNSHDRTVGAEAVIRALLAAGAVGLVTTHDLAIAGIAEDPELNALNVHFQDEMVDGKMVFDYCLRPGVVQKSNAIPLMRAVGLDV